MTPTEACERLTSDEVLCANEAAQATGSVLCGIKADGLKVIPSDAENPAPFYVSIVEDGGLSQLENIDTSIGHADSPAITNPATNGALISFIRGILTVLNTVSSGISTAITHLSNLVNLTTDIEGDVDTLVTNSNTSVARTNTLGQKNMAGSMPVVLASDQTNIATTDAGPAWTTGRGVDANGLPYDTGDASSGQPVTMAPTSGQKLVITDLTVSVAMDCILDIYEENNNRMIFRLYLTAKQTYTIVSRGKLKLTTANNRLCIKPNVSGNIMVQTMYYSEA